MVKKVELWFKNRKVKFSDEDEKTQSAKKINPSDGMPTDFFAPNRKQDINGGHLDKNSMTFKLLQSLR